jgi:hypothetical protein
MASPYTTPVPNLTTFEALRYQVQRPHFTAYHQLTDPKTMLYISFEITRRLEGVIPGRHIVVPDATIVSVMDSLWQNYQDDPYVLTMAVVAYVTQHIRTEFQQERQNNELSIWVQSREGNWGLSRHDQLKLRERRPTPMIFSNQY